MSRLVPVLVISLALAGCAALPGVAPSGPQPPPPPDEVSATPAVSGLVARADSSLGLGDYDRAALQLERALRIEPRNAALWQRLARIRLAQGGYAQAIQLASKSNTLAAADAALRRNNWLIIAEAHERNGDLERARAARARAVR